MSAVPSAARDPEAEYYQTVEEFFVSRRGDPLFLSNADWNLVRKWRLAGIPLRVVLRGIRDALDAHARGWSRERRVGSLSYCAREVDAARERWARALGAAGEAAAPASALLGFASALERGSGLGPRARAVAGAIVAELRASGPPPGLEALTCWLAQRERELLEALFAEDPEQERQARESEVERRLARWQGRMPEPVLQQLRADSLARLTLEAHALPRLSLFHLEGGGAGA